LEKSEAMRFAVDTGGTFTDLLIEADDCLHMFKTPTTPANPLDGIIAAFTAAGDGLEMSRGALLAQGDLLVHGTTIATNAVLTRRTARTALLTTAGHPDVLVLREGGRMGLPMFDYSIAFPKPYVPRALTFEVPERIGPDGSVIRPLDEDAVRHVCAALKDRAIEAVAVSFLWSILNPAHELKVAEILNQLLPGVFVSLSHNVNPSLREYRRASATAIDASLKPVMQRYLEELTRRLQAEGFRGRTLVVTSQGMMKDAAEVAAAPIHAVKSGPAMAPIAGRYYAEHDLAVETAIVADTGGTTYDVALVRRSRIPETRETWVGRPYLGHMTGFPSIDIRSVGAGGGSIAWVDDGGLLHVGPDSAGAVPGPACYARGGSRPTVTDVAVVLGYVDPDLFLGGRMRLDATLARSALHRHVAAPLNLTVEDAALAVLALLTETMAGAIEDITVNQGIDARGAVLIGGGGAAGLNSVAIARRLGGRTILFPETGAALSATGGLLGNLSDDFAEICVTSSASFGFAAVNGTLDRLRSKCQSFLDRVGAVDGASIEFSVEARYSQQIWEIKLPLPVPRFESAADLGHVCDLFHELHRDVFAFDDRGAEIEFINWRAMVSAELRRGSLGRLKNARADDRALYTRRAVFAHRGVCDVSVHRLEALTPTPCAVGPCIIEAPFTTIVIDSDATVRLSHMGSLIVEIVTQTSGAATP
jgi:N-methylhydantoinase A